MMFIIIIISILFIDQFSFYSCNSADFSTLWRGVPQDVDHFTSESKVTENYTSQTRIGCSVQAKLKSFPTFCYFGTNCMLFDATVEVSSASKASKVCYTENPVQNEVCAGQPDGTYNGKSCSSVTVCNQGNAYSPIQKSTCDDPFVNVPNIGCVYMPPQTMNFCDARYLCLSMSSDLWSMPASFLHLQAYASANALPVIWVGLTRIAGTIDWVWYSGEMESIHSIYWGVGEPGNAAHEILACVSVGKGYLLADTSDYKPLNPFCLRK